MSDLTSGNSGTNDVQLFTPAGQYVTTVNARPYVGVIVWRSRAFAAREGRFVEVTVQHTDEQPR